MDDNDIIRAYAIICPWYKKFEGRALVLLEASLEKVHKMYATLLQAEVLGTELLF